MKEQLKKAVKYDHDLNGFRTFYLSKDAKPLKQILTDNQVEKLRVAMHWLSGLTREAVNV